MSFSLLVGVFGSVLFLSLLAGAFLLAGLAFSFWPLAALIVALATVSLFHYAATKRVQSGQTRIEH